jgi:hypothetical protein
MDDGTILALLQEVFEGPPGEYGSLIEHGSGLLSTLAEITPEEASTRPAPGRPTLAAFAAHLLDGLHYGLAELRGEAFTGSWEAAWQMEQVDEGAWQALQAEIGQAWSETWALAERGKVSLGSLLHTTLHLGGLRAMWKGIRAQRG